MRERARGEGESHLQRRQVDVQVRQQLHELEEGDFPGDRGGPRRQQRQQAPHLPEVLLPVARGRGRDRVEGVEEGARVPQHEALRVPRGDAEGGQHAPEAEPFGRVGVPEPVKVRRARAGARACRGVKDRPQGTLQLGAHPLGVHQALQKHRTRPRRQCPRVPRTPFLVLVLVLVLVLFRVTVVGAPGRPPLLSVL